MSKNLHCSQLQKLNEKLTSMPLEKSQKLPVVPRTKFAGSVLQWISGGPLGNQYLRFPPTVQYMRPFHPAHFF